MLELFPSYDDFVSLFDGSVCDSRRFVLFAAEVFADTETPVSAFLKLARDRTANPSAYAALLESVEGDGRYSYIAYDPVIAVRAREGDVELLGNSSVERRCPTGGEDILSIVRTVLEEYLPHFSSELSAFCGGALGYVGYDLLRQFERRYEATLTSDCDPLELPDLLLFVPGTLLLFDNLSHKLRVLSLLRLPSASGSRIFTAGDLEELYEEGRRKLEGVVIALREATAYPPSASPSGSSCSGSSASLAGSDVECMGFGGWSSNRSKGAFEDMVREGIRYIEAGDAIQVVLSQRLSRSSDVDPFDVYRALRTVNPSPYMFFLQMGDFAVSGSSPELLVKLRGGDLELRPIAGTRPRGGSSCEDELLERELLADPKERAEHIMLVDLGRNDLGRVSDAATVRVCELMKVDRYSHVLHLVSRIEGRLAPGLDMFDVFRASFPAGTLSGAPKVRAVEIIDELEASKRGLYGGAVGFFDFSGDMEMCIAIRMAIFKDGLVHIQAGAGIVADSSPEREYLETLNKAKGVLCAVDLAERGLCNIKLSRDLKFSGQRD